MPLCSGLRSFCREVRWQPYGGSLEYDCFPLSAFRILFLSLTFTIWIICPDVHLFGFILFGALCVSCTSWISVSFFRFGNFSAIISSHSIPFSLCSSGVPIIPVLVCLMLFQRSLKLFVFFKLVFLFAVLFVGFPLFCLPDQLHILLYHLVCCSFLLVWFFFFYLSYWIIHSLLRLFTFLSSLLTFSLCTPILYPSSVNIFITNSLNYFSGKLLVSVHYFFRAFPLAFLIANSSFVFSSCLTFSAFMNIVETVTYIGLEGVFWWGSVPVQTTCTWCLWWENWSWCGCKSRFSSVCGGSCHLGKGWGWRWGVS